MENNSLQLQSSNNLPELVQPKLERMGIELENILRWEDDGGQMGNSDSKPVLITDVGDRVYHTRGAASVL